MKIFKAFFAGLAGGAAMSLLMLGLRAAGLLPVNLEMLLGTMLGAEQNQNTWLIGLGIHLMISGLIALIYAAGFEYVTHYAGWRVGAGFGLIHALIGGVVMGAMPALHPLVPEAMAAPGPFLSHFGPLGVAAFFATHVVYGAIVGAIYGRTVHVPVNRHAHA
jgi:hypothetical protein